MSARNSMHEAPKRKINRTQLTEEEIESCRQSFQLVDRNNSGTLDLGELKQVMQDMGQNPTEEELFVMITAIDEDGSGGITFEEFLKAISNQKFFNGLDRQPKAEDETDFIDAYVALGGSADKTGSISAEKLKSTLQLFDLAVDFGDQFIKDADADGSGNIEFAEFKRYLQDQNIS